MIPANQHEIALQPQIFLLLTFKWAHAFYTDISWIVFAFSFSLLDPMKNFLTANYFSAYYEI
jgi:hypothetical protein